MARPLSRLFHAVVVVGASLSACDPAEPAPSPPPGPAAATPTPALTPPPQAGLPEDGAPPAVEADAAIAASTAPPPPVGLPAATPRPSTSMRPQAPADPRGERCPPGSEAPFPPCFHIL